MNNSVCPSCGNKFYIDEGITHNEIIVCIKCGSHFHANKARSKN